METIMVKKIPFFLMGAVLAVGITAAPGVASARPTVALQKPVIVCTPDFGCFSCTFSGGVGTCVPVLQADDPVKS